MKDLKILWVLGHRIRPFDTDESYGMVEVTSPPGVPGPPPHFHDSESEFFFIVKGALDVMNNGHWRTCPAGSFVEIMPDIIHTFINNTDEEVVWITGWRPKGFQKFFYDFGIPAPEENAREKSVANDLIQNVVERAVSYGMHVKQS
jgi:quercetin dioxygenase-like cupin family protein